MVASWAWTDEAHLVERDVRLRTSSLLPRRVSGWTNFRLLGIKDSVVCNCCCNCLQITMKRCFVSSFYTPSSWFYNLLPLYGREAVLALLYGLVNFFVQFKPQRDRVFCINVLMRQVLSGASGSPLCNIVPIWELNLQEFPWIFLKITGKFEEIFLRDLKEFLLKVIRIFLSNLKGNSRKCRKTNYTASFSMHLSCKNRILLRG